MKHKITYIPSDSNNATNINYSYYICSCGWQYEIPYPPWVVSRDSFHRMKIIEHVLEAEGLAEFPNVPIEED